MLGFGQLFAGLVGHEGVEVGAGKVGAGVAGENFGLHVEQEQLMGGTRPDLADQPAYRAQGGFRTVDRNEYSRHR